MVNVELVYDEGCPTLKEARRNLAAAMMKLGLEPHWTEVERSSPMATWARSFASPTILVNREDVVGSAVPGAMAKLESCETDARPAPPVAVIADAIARALAREWTWIAAEKQRSSLRDTLLITFGCLGCCLPFLVASMASAGLFTYLRSSLHSPTHAWAVTLPLTALAVIGLYLEGRKSSYKPFLLGVASVLLLYGGLLAWRLSLLVWIAFALLVCAVGWAVLEHRSRTARGCSSPNCAT